MLLPVMLALSCTDRPASRQDGSHPSVRFVTVDDNVRLETIDWGGSGRPVVLLAGGGNTAHVYDDFAPKLTADYHVYGITRRGFGASGFAVSKDRYPVDRMRDDILAIIDTLGVERPVLVGHSIGGAEMSAVATLHPDRVAGLVYLDAGYPYAFDNGTGPATSQLPPISTDTLPTWPTPSDSDLVSFKALQRWNARVDGYPIPEAEWRQLWDSTSDGRVVKPREPAGMNTLLTILQGPKKFPDLPAPALVIYAIPHVLEAWIRNATDPSVHEVANAYLSRVDPLVEKQAKALENGAPTARVIRLRGHHYVFISNEADVLRAMHAFLRGLK